jgi:glucose-6-phosphate isomerase
MKTTIEGSQGLLLDFSVQKGVQPDSLADAAEAARQILLDRSGAGNDFLGWIDLPETLDDALISDIEAAATMIRNTDALVVIGIGGSYLGARAVIDALSSPFDKRFEVFFAGHQLDADYHAGLLEYLKDKRYAVNVISKSGTTTEPAAAYRLFYDDLKSRFGRAALKELIFATTDKSKGTLRAECERDGLSSFIVPDDVGGRFSVLTPVGLLPIAAAGFDIRALVEGARTMRALVTDPASNHIDTNPALAYAAFRNAAYRQGKKIEVLVSYVSRLAMAAEWWKQLFGESEGKDGKGIFPASCNFTSDLHSLGQMMQDGERTLFETVIDVVNAADVTIPKGEAKSRLDGRKMNDVNRTVVKAALEAHTDGKVPCLRLELPEISEKTIGALLYFYEFSCGVSAYMLGVNPFNQPGVETYKKHLMRLLDA